MIPKRSSGKHSRRSSNDGDKHPSVDYSNVRRDTNLKSCMKVATVEESLRKADENDERRKAMAREGSKFGLLKKGLSVRGNRRGSMLKSIKRGMSIRGSRGGMKKQGNGQSGARRRSGLSRGLSKMGAFLSRRNLNGVGRTSTKIDEEETPSSTDHARHSQVSFSTLRFRWYELKAVDNPGVSKGFAMGIGGWDYEEDEAPTPLDVHEEYRSTVAPRRKLEDIKVCEEERYRRLLDSGVTQSELARVRKSINLAKGRRRKTLEGAANMKNEERREGAIRKLKKMLGMKKGYDKEMKDLWDAAQKRDISDSGRNPPVVLAQ